MKTVKRIYSNPGGKRRTERLCASGEPGKKEIVQSLSGLGAIPAPSRGDGLANILLFGKRALVLKERKGRQQEPFSREKKARSDETRNDEVPRNLRKGKKRATLDRNIGLGTLLRLQREGKSPNKRKGHV